MGSRDSNRELRDILRKVRDGVRAAVDDDDRRVLMERDLIQRIGDGYVLTAKGDDHLDLWARAVYDERRAGV